MQLSKKGAQPANLVATMNLVRTTLVCAALLSVAPACDSGPPPLTGADAVAAGGAGASGAPLRTGVAPISFEAKKAGTKPFPFPFVEGMAFGKPTRFLLDTGASVHVLDASVAAGVQPGAQAKASSLSIDGFGALPEHAVVVRELPASLRAHGIGGIVSPQLLAETADQAVVVDLVSRRLRVRPRSAAATEVADIGANLSGPGRKLCPAESDGVAGRALAVDAVVDGEPTHLTIDTGASRSMLLEGSKPGARAVTHPVLGRSLVAGSAADVAMSIYGAVPFTVGAWSSPLDVGVGTGHRPAQCGSEGRLGMDVLQQCAIAMTSDEALVACRAAGAPAP